MLNSFRNSNVLGGIVHLTTNKVWAATLLLSSLAALSPAQAQTLLLSQPSLSRDNLAFVYAGDIWVTNRAGQNPTRLTAHPATEFAPKISNDGKWVAFSGNYDGNIDVYVVSINGGQPKRLTWHSAPDVVNGWSADGRRILFASPREVANSSSNQLYEIAVEGGFESKVMNAVAVSGSWAADGKRLAYQPYRSAYGGGNGWRQHREILGVSGDIVTFVDLVLVRVKSASTAKR